MNEQRRDFVGIMKYEAVPPCDDGTGQGPM